MTEVLKQETPVRARLSPVLPIIRTGQRRDPNIPPASPARVWRTACPVLEGRYRWARTGVLRCNTRVGDEETPVPTRYLPAKGPSIPPIPTANLSVMMYNVQVILFTLSLMRFNVQKIKAYPSIFVLSTLAVCQFCNCSVSFIAEMFYILRKG
jgi:hypothetical protein